MIEQETVNKIALGIHQKRFKKERLRYSCDQSFAEGLFLKVIKLEARFNEINRHAQQIALISKTSEPECVSVEEFKKLLEEYDHTYRYSDDRRAYNKGEAQESRIFTIMKNQPELQIIYKDFFSRLGTFELREVAPK